jgi:hypothetical protein
VCKQKACKEIMCSKYPWEFGNPCVLKVFNDLPLSLPFFFYMCSKDNIRFNNVNASFNNMVKHSWITWTWTWIKLEGIEASLSSYKLPNLDSIVEDEPRVLIPPLLEKKEVKLEICRVFERCHGYCYDLQLNKTWKTSNL